MIVLDTNILVYAHIPDFPQHHKVGKWLESTLSDGGDSIGLVWQAISGFLRIITNPRIFDEPRPMDFARACIDDLLSHPLVHQVHTTEKHWKIYSKLVTELNIIGDVVTDAHIAAIAVEHKAAVATTDKDFRRFSDYVKIIDPLKTK